MKNTELCARSKVWLEDEKGKPVFGQGRIQILKAIAEHGSINAAAKSLKMSYRGVWAKIKATEKRMGRPLLERSVGGKAGGGSSLTPFAMDLMERFERFQNLVEKETDNLFTNFFKDLAKDSQG